jgi:hypothetical protein
MSKYPKKPYCYECILCTYKCSKQSEFDKHLSTAKHKKLAELNPNISVSNEKIIDFNAKQSTPPITIIKETRVYTCSICY